MVLLVERTCGWCARKTQGLEAQACVSCGAPLPAAPLPWLEGIALPRPFGEPPPHAPRHVPVFPPWRSMATDLAAVVGSLLFCGFTVVIPVLVLMNAVTQHRRHDRANTLLRDGRAATGVVTYVTPAKGRQTRSFVHFAYTAEDGREHIASYVTPDPRAATLLPGTPIWVVYDPASPEDVVPWPPMQPA